MKTTFAGSGLASIILYTAGTATSSWPTVLPDSLVPDVTIQGVPDEYRSLMEARLVEGDRGNLLLINLRSGYDWEVEVTPREYQSEKIRLPTHGAAHRLVRRISNGRKQDVHSRVIDNWESPKKLTLE